MTWLESLDVKSTVSGLWLEQVIELIDLKQVTELIDLEQETVCFGSQF